MFILPHLFPIWKTEIQKQRDLYNNKTWNGKRNEKKLKRRKKNIIHAHLWYTWAWMKPNQPSFTMISWTTWNEFHFVCSASLFVGYFSIHFDTSGTHTVIVYNHIKEITSEAFRFVKWQKWLWSLNECLF